MTIARYEDERVRLSDYGPVARAGVFLAVFTLALLTLRPFADLREELSDEPIVGRDALTYLLFSRSPQWVSRWLAAMPHPPSPRWRRVRSSRSPAGSYSRR